ncbi:MAG: hypothetical protein IPO63_00355 [Bacteroidetes bacterium]|nr:hypothetical protein [Bacteroidota bacterium]
MEKTQLQILKLFFNKYSFLLLLMILVSMFSFGQGGYKPHALLSPMWQVDEEYLEPSEVKDTTMENGHAATGFSFRFPLYLGKDWLSADGGKPYFAVLLHGGATGKISQLDFLEPDRILTMGRLGITALMAKGLRNLYLIQFSTSLPSESFNFKLNYLRFHGALVWRKLYHNNTWWHTLGVMYTPVMGRDLPLPLLGFGIKLGNDDQVQMTFPFNAMYTHVFSKKISLSAKIQNTGGYHYLKPDSIYQDEPLLYRFQYYRVGVLARYYTTRHVVITPEVGMTTSGSLQIDDYKAKQVATPYLRISLQVRFGKRPPVAPILNFDPGDSGFDPAYLVE